MRKLSLILLLFTTLGILSAKNYFVKDFVSVIDVNKDGTLDVEESMLYQFEGGPFKWVRRDVRASRDGYITLNQALVDGKQIPLGNDPGMVKIKNSANLHAKFNLDNITDQAIHFTLDYKVFNAFKVKNNKAVLEWRPIPDKYDFLIKTGKVTFNFPKDIAMYDIVTFLDNVKNVEYEEVAHSLVCSFTNLDGKSFNIKANLPLKEMALINYETTSRVSELLEEYPNLKPYTMIYKYLLGILVLYLIYVMFVLIRRYNLQVKDLPKITKLPSHKHPALVARLLQVGSDDINLIPVLMQMAIKQLISFTQVTDKKGRAVKDYYVDIADDVSKANEIDLGYLELLKKEEARRGKRIELKALVSDSYRFRKDLLKLINKKFNETGFIDVEKKKKYYQKVSLFFILLVIAVSMAIFGGIFFFKGNAFAPIPAFLLTGYWIYMMLHLDEKNILSSAGLEKWKEWKSFRRYIAKSLTTKANDLDPYDAEDVFPYVLIMGYGEQYLHYFKKKNIELNFPNLGEIAADIESLNMLITIVVMSSATHGVSGGSGGGGGGASAG